MKRRTVLQKFAKYTAFNVLGMVGLSCYILADTFFVAQSLGANGLTALNLAIPIFSFFIGIGLMFGMGGATKYTIAKSQGHDDKANRIFSNTVYLATFAGLIFFLLGLFGSETIAQLLGTDETVLDLSQMYIKVVLLFAPWFIWNNIIQCFVRNDGAPQLSMFAMLGGSLSNIILDYVFMFPLKMEMFGAALATGLAPIVSLLILAPYFLKRRNQFHLTSYTAKQKLNRDTIATGLPSLVTELSSGIVIIIFNGLILKLLGNVGVAAYGIIANLSLVVIAIYTGIAQGIQPLLSSYHGTNNQTALRLVLGYALITMGAISLISYAIILIAADPIASLFNSQQNAELQTIAVQGLKLYFSASLFAGFNIIIAIVFSSTERPRPAHLIALARGFVVNIPLAFILAAFAGMTGIWLVFPVTEIIVSLLAIWLFRSNQSSRKQVIKATI